MKFPHRLTLTITPDSYTWAAFSELGSEPYAVHTMKRETTGWRGTKKAAVFERDLGHDELCEAIEGDDLSDVLTIMGAT